MAVELAPLIQAGSQIRPHHILEAQQFSAEWLNEEFFPESRRMKELLDADGHGPLHPWKSICLLFYEPSTRTRLSFDQAAKKLGMEVVSTENAKEFSSAIKGESIKDTSRVVNRYRFDAIVIRSHITGGATEAASVSRIPVINAGDGGGQHPSQTLLDGFTIAEKFGTINGLNIALVGDLKNGRTARSLGYLAGKYKGVHLELVAPPEYQMSPDLLEYFERHNVSYHKTDNLTEAAAQADVIYLTRLQKEREKLAPLGMAKRLIFQKLARLAKINKTIGTNGLSASEYQVQITDEVMDRTRNSTAVMHPLPRSDDFDELPERFTDDPRVIIFDQVENGLYTRMALYHMLLS